MHYEPHVVRQGEYLTLLAYQRGADVDAVWQHEKNSELREARMSRDILAPGDIVWLPVVEEKLQSLATQSSNAFRVDVPKNHIRLVFAQDGLPLKKEAYVITGLGDEPLDGETDDDGVVTFEAPLSTTQVRLTFIERNLRHDVRIGHLDPIESEEGVRQRLENLGHAGWVIAPRPHDPIHEWTAERMDHAVRSFQRSADLAVTGTIDDALRAALLDAHGS
jgi:hypothetical protein